MKPAQIEHEQVRSWADKYHSIWNAAHKEQGALLALWKADAEKNGRSVEEEWEKAGISQPTASRKIRYASEGLPNETYAAFRRRVEPSMPKTVEEGSDESVE